MAQDLALLDEISRQVGSVGATDINDEASSGIQASFPTVSIKDKEWTLKFQGVEKTHVNEDGEPSRSIDVILIQPGRGLTKAWWPHTYQTQAAGVARVPPQCTSVDGDKPDPSSPQVQSVTCAGCKWNVFGSTVLIGGTGKAKACRDSKRFAVFLPTNLLEAPPYRAALLRIPPTSLKNLDEYSRVLKGKGVGLDRVITRLSFQAGKQTMIEFKAVAALPQQTYDNIVLQTRQDPNTGRMLTQAVATIPGEYEDEDRQQSLERSPLPTGFEAFGVGAEPGPAQTQPTQAAPQPVTPVQQSVQQPVAQTGTPIQLKDGRWFDPVSKKFVEAPAAKKVRPDTVVEAEDGTFIDLATGEVWEDEEALPFSPTAKPAAKPVEAAPVVEAPAPAAKAEAPATDLLKAKKEKAAKTAKAGPAPVKETPAPKASGNGATAAGPVVVTDADQELGDALKELFPGGLPE